MTDQEKVKRYFSGYLIFGNQLARIININIYNPFMLCCGHSIAHSLNPNSISFFSMGIANPLYGEFFMDI